MTCKHPRQANPWRPDRSLPCAWPACSDGLTYTDRMRVADTHPVDGLAEATFRRVAEWSAEVAANIYRWVVEQ